MLEPYTPIIGLEIHAHVKTKTKMFCDSLNDPDEKTPNTNICPVCLAHPGTLPVINEEAVKKVILAGIAMDCTIAHDTFFERKNYFYPDLPKGYQISQYQKPLCENGSLTIKSGKKVRITRIHLEEDAGRLYHTPGSEYSLVDFNRAGVPLMELVTEPDLASASEVREFASELQLLLKYCGVSDADMEKGLMRVEVNISLTGKDGKWGTKVEVKNLNSIKAAHDAVNYEIERQRELLEKGEKIDQETRGWDENKKRTFSQRSKEEAHDYRYFPEPDLPPLSFDDKYIDDIRKEIPELPSGKRSRFKDQYGLPDSDIEIFVVSRELGNFYEHVASEIQSLESQDRAKLLKLASNYTITELQKLVSESGSTIEDSKITPENFAQLILQVAQGNISSSAAQIVLRETFATGQDPDQIIKEKDLGQVSDLSELSKVIDGVIKDNPKAVEDLKKGKDAPVKFLIGMVMRETKGKANPQVVEKIIRENL